MICVGFVENSSLMVSLDRGGQLLLWPYRKDHYSGFGWFRPSKQMQVGLALTLAQALALPLTLALTLTPTLTLTLTTNPNH